MNKRETVIAALRGEKMRYVPWHYSFTIEAAQKLLKHFNCPENKLDEVLDNHLIRVNGLPGQMKDLGNSRVRDVFGVVWDRSEDGDIGVIEGCVLPEPTMDGYRFPDPEDEVFYKTMKEVIAKQADGLRVYEVGFSLFERAWSLRGIENLLMDFYENPDFVRRLLRDIADFNISVLKNVLKHDMDAVMFGDDWGQQHHGLIMGPKIWNEFIFPELRRMYKTVKDSGKLVIIHSCGDVDEIFDPLIEIGLDCFNPFQPEVMDIHSIALKYKGRLSFYGGLSTQKTLPYGSPEDVRKESLDLIAAGMDGNYIFAPAHAVEGDVPLENMLAFIETARKQPGFLAK